MVEVTVKESVDAVCCVSCGKQLVKVEALGARSSFELFCPRCRRRIQVRATERPDENLAPQAGLQPRKEEGHDLPVQTR